MVRLKADCASLVNASASSRKIILNELLDLPAHDVDAPFVGRVELDEVVAPVIPEYLLGQR